MTRPTPTCAILLALLALGAPALAQEASTIPEVARATGSFTALGKALRAAGLEETLRGEGPFTVFAPSDAAFAKLPPERLSALLADRAALRQVLLHHVARGRRTAREVVQFESVRTLAGESLRIQVGARVQIGAASVLRADVEASNGVIHVIDQVLLPESLQAGPGSLVAVAKAAGGFEVLLAAAKAAGLLEVLDAQGPFTLLAPSDAAFGVLPPQALQALLQDRERLTRLLQHHVVAGRLPASALAERSELVTLAKTRLVVDVRQGVRVAGARVATADVVARNGVIHVIDRVLLPPAPKATPSVSAAPTFPTYRGKNLEGQPYVLPGGLTGERNLVLIPFLQWQQGDVNTWLEWLGRSPLAARTGFAYWELPTVQDRGEGFQRFLDRGMALGIPDPAARARTITVYTDLAAFLKRLEIPGTSKIQVLLLDKAGRVLWRCEGPFSPAKGQELLRALEGAKTK